MDVRRMRVIATLTSTPQGAALGFEGSTLGQWLAEFGGFVGKIDDPFGQWHEVSMAAFDGADPNLFVDFMFEEQSEVGVTFNDDALTDDQVVLSEWPLVDHPATRSAADYLGPDDGPPRWGLHR